MKKLSTYRKKRDFKRTPEPLGKREKGQGGRFVVEARRQVVITLLLGDLRIGKFLAEIDPGGLADKTLTNRILGGRGWRWGLRERAEVDSGEENATQRVYGGFHGFLLGLVT